MGRHLASARETIIDAAEDVVIETGARHMTLDAIAARAKVSRGGLLYHFPNKEALLRAMLERRVNVHTQSRKDLLASLSEGREREAIALVLSLLKGDEKVKKVSAALLAAVAHDPRLLMPYRQEFRKIIDEMTEGGLRFERAAAIALAVDGLMFVEFLGLSPFDKKERGRIIKEIIALAKEEASGP